MSASVWQMSRPRARLATWRRSFDGHRIVVGGDTVVSEATVTDGEQSARVIAFSDVVDGHIARQVEYWPTP